MADEKATVVANNKLAEQATAKVRRCAIERMLTSARATASAAKLTQMRRSLLQWLWADVHGSNACVAPQPLRLHVPLRCRHNTF